MFGVKQNSEFLDLPNNFILCQDRLQFAVSCCEKLGQPKAGYLVAARNECDELELADEYVRVTTQKLCK
jgi:hypothetical protein